MWMLFSLRTATGQAQTCGEVLRYSGDLCRLRNDAGMMNEDVC